LKIAFVTPATSMHEKLIAATAVERGHEVLVISNRHVKPEFDVHGVVFHHYHPVVARLRTIQIVMHLKKVLREFKPDIVLSSLPVSDGFLVALTGFHPHITCTWGTDILHTPYTTWLAGQRTRFAVRRADAIICNTAQIRNTVHQLVPSSAPRTHFLPIFAINLNLFTPKRSGIRSELGWTSNKILIMTRTHYPAIYGIEYFVEAIPLILKAESNVRIIIAGSGSLDCELHQRLVELDVMDKVRWLGTVDQKALAGYLNASDIYVSTNLSDGLSNSLLEAMAVALPVVVSAIPPNQDWVVNGENGLLVDVGDLGKIGKAINRHLRDHPDLWNEVEASSSDFPMPVSPSYSQDIATAVIALLREPELRAEMGRRNLRIARERADLDTQFAEFERLAERLIAEHRGQVNGAPAHSDAD